MQIFISYSSKDLATVSHLAEDLELIDYSVWYDKALSRSGGQAWWTLILEQIRLSDVFLFALTPHAVRSEPCRREYQYARALGKPILPVLLADLEVRTLPPDVQAIQLVPFQDRSREQLKLVKASLRNLPPAPALPEPLPPEPSVPLDPLGVLLHRIEALTTDADQQKLLIFDLDDLIENGGFHEQLAALLTRLLSRDDVLTVRYHQRVREMLLRVQTQIVSALPPPESATEEPSSPSDRPRTEHTPGSSGSTVIDMPPGSWIVDDQGVVMVYVPAGAFSMGSTPDEVEQTFRTAQRENSAAQKTWFTDQMPQHEVIIPRPFWIDMTPVTNAMYAQFVAAGAYRKRSLWTVMGWKFVQDRGLTGPHNYADALGPDEPRVGVTWHEAYAYCAWRGGRLASEAEWEWAARGPERLLFPWGNTFDPSRVIYAKNAAGKAATVGFEVRKLGAAWVGALDMSGNVAEWTNSLYFPYPYHANDGRETAASSDTARVLRGGSWSVEHTTDLRTTYRDRNHPDTETPSWGFRCVRTI